MAKLLKNYVQILRYPIELLQAEENIFECCFIPRQVLVDNGLDIKISKGAAGLRTTQLFPMLYTITKHCKLGF